MTQVYRAPGWTACRTVALTLLLLILTVRTAAERLPVRTYTTADGLPRDRIAKIVHDSRGFLWFCTAEGLSRFDGYKFINYGLDQGLPGRHVNDFLEARDGTYWVATDKGLCRFVSDRASHGRMFEVYYPSDDSSARYIITIYEDRAGTIWCGTFAGIFHLTKKNGQFVFTFVDIVQPSTSADDRLRVDAITQDRQGSLWIGASSGVYRRKADGVVERYAAAEGLAPNGITRALLEDREGRMWDGTVSGLYQFVPDPQPGHPLVARAYTTRDGLASNYVSSLCQFSDGTLWAGTEAGLSRLVSAQGVLRVQSYNSANGLSDQDITALAEDRDGDLWIGTSVGGAMRLASRGFTTYDQADGLGGTSIASIFEDRDGRLRVISSNSLISRFDGTRFDAATFTLPAKEFHWSWGWYQITFQDSVGEWWGPMMEGLVRYPRLAVHAAPKAVYTIQDGLPSNTIFRIFEDSRRDIWIGTLGNLKGVLTRWERATQTFHTFSAADGIPESAPSAFCEDGSRNLWIGFYLGGLLRYSGGRFTPFTASDGVGAGLVRGLYLDHSNRLWVATAEGGATRIDNPDDAHPRFVSYSTGTGLASDQATCVTEDKWGEIYIGTGRGVDKLDPATGHIRHFTTADGLANSFVNVCLGEPDGSLWFGTMQGLSRLIPQAEGPISPPRILITSFQVAGIPYPVSELGTANLPGPEIAASHNNIQIDFVGLGSGVGENLRYEFKLEGARSEWSAPTDQRSVNYPNLPPGSYRFLVRTRRADGQLSESPASVSFRVLRPFWQQWWFLLLAAILMIVPIAIVGRLRYQHQKAVRAAEAALRRSREERLQELEQVRRRIATDLHDDIGSSLSQIFLLSEVVRQRIGDSNSVVEEPLTMISNASHEVVSSMSDIVWAINPQKDHLSDLIQRMRRFASDTLAAAGIDFRFNAPDSESDIRLGANLRREVFLIFKESVNNIVKHSACSKAEIEVRIAGESLSLTVHDDGEGFDPSQDGNGHGLASMRERASSIGAQLDLVSGKGAGTTVTLGLSVTANTGGASASPGV